MDGFVGKVPIFKGLAPEDLKAISTKMVRKTYAADEIIFEQGDVGDAFYIVAGGSCNVLIRPATVISVGDTVECMTDLTFRDREIKKGTLATVDKMDPSRE